MASTGDSREESKSPKSNNASPPQPACAESQPDQRKPDTALKPESSSSANAEDTKPLAPPPRPGQQSDANTPDYFANQIGDSLNLEPNPFEQSFGAPASAADTPGGTKLPSVASLTSPSSLLPGNNATPFPWGGGSLRTGPLSPAMLSGPTNDYFGETHHMRGGFPTPNESSMRTGLTPGGGGSMFPAPSPNSQAIFAQLANSGATPGTLDFHRTALSAAAAAKREQQQPQQQSITSQPQDMPTSAAAVKPETKATAGHFDPHDNDAANGLFMLAQGRNNAQPQTQYAMAPQQQVHAQHPPGPAPQTSISPKMANGSASAAGSSARGASEAGSAASDESEQARPNTRGKGKRNSNAGAGAAAGRRKAEDAPAKPPASKKTKTNGAGASAAAEHDMDMEPSDDDADTRHDEGGSKGKMTDEEKRKNFLERNRVAALKCRQRKKQWLANLQSKVEIFSSENENLTNQISQLREEVVNLKTLLLAHKDCPVTQQQSMHGGYMQQPMEPFNPQMNPYGMAAPLANQQVMAGQGVQRRIL